MAKFTLQQVADACGGQVAPEFAAVTVNGVCSDSPEAPPGAAVRCPEGRAV